MSHPKLLNILAIFFILFNTNYGDHTAWPDSTCCECLEAIAGVGCSADALCQAIVCAGDSWCCNVNWDNTCVNEADCICGCAHGHDPETPSPIEWTPDTPSPIPWTPDTPAPIPWAPDTPAPIPWTPDTPSPIPWTPDAELDCCQCLATSAAPGCSANLPCQNLICPVDPWCCNTNWDSTCVSQANDVCSQTPSPIPWAPDTPAPVQWSPPGEWCPNSQRVCDRAGECCSQWGWCGTTASHCAEHGEWCPNANRFCTVDECCSEHGYCGTGDAYCGMSEPHPWDTPSPIQWAPNTPSPVTWTPDTPAPIPWGPNTPYPTPWMHCDSVANCDCVPPNNGQPGHGCNGKCDGWYRACPDSYNGVWTSNYDHFVMCANGDYFLRPCANEGWNPWTHQFDRLTWNDYDKTCDWSTSDRPNCDPYQEPGP